MNERDLYDMSMLVADSGGTKTDWVYLGDNDAYYFSGNGMHPAYMTVDQIANEIMRTVTVTPDYVYFYGAGCHGPEPLEKIEQAFQKVFSETGITVKDDLSGVARAHLQQGRGLIVALGTGSICGRYEAGEILKRSAALGYAIGDEGSAADLGRTILKAYFRENLDPQTAELTSDRFNNVSYSDWMDRIYGSDRPNRELAAVAGMVFVHPLTHQLKELLSFRFFEFIDSQFSSLSPDQSEQIVCTGSVAVAHSELLLEAFSNRGFNHVSIKENVIEGLARYHSL